MWLLRGGAYRRWSLEKSCSETEFCCHWQGWMSQLIIITSHTAGGSVRSWTKLDFEYPRCYIERMQRYLYVWQLICPKWNPSSRHYLGVIPSPVSANHVSTIKHCKNSNSDRSNPVSAKPNRTTFLPNRTEPSQTEFGQFGQTCSANPAEPKAEPWPNLRQNNVQLIHPNPRANPGRTQGRTMFS